MARKVVERNISYDDEKKLYYVNMDYGKDESGKRVKKNPTFKTKQEAKTSLKLFEADKARGNIVIPKGTTLEQWLSYWMANIIKPNRAETTYYGYNQIIVNHIIPILGSIPIQKLTPQQLQQYYSKKMNDETSPLSGNTLRKHHDLLKTALKAAVMQDALLRNPLDKVEAPRVKICEKSYYSPEQLILLFQLVEGDRLEVPVKLAGYLGLRREEVCGLKWENVDFRESKIYIRNAMTTAGSKVILKETKTASSARTLYLPDDLHLLLNKEKAKQEESKRMLGEAYTENGFIVQWEDGRPYRPNYISELFTKFLEAHSLPKIVLHELRHTFASIANSTGTSLFDIGKALGHSTPSTTGKIYTHLLDENNEEALKRVASKISNAKK